MEGGKAVQIAVCDLVNNNLGVLTSMRKQVDVDRKEASFGGRARRADPKIDEHLPVSTQARPLRHS